MESAVTSSQSTPSAPTRSRLSLRQLTLPALMLAVAAITLALQAYNVGFENGHHGWPSVHGLAIFSHVSPETRFVGHALAFVEADGTLSYDYFDRYPLFFGAFMRLLLNITDHLPTEIMIFRYVMNIIFLLTMLGAYRLVRLFMDHALLAFGVTVTAFSSFYVVYYKDMIHYDQPALLGMVWLLVAIGRHMHGRGARWHVYAAALVAVGLGRGYASVFVIGLWFLVEAVAALGSRKGLGAAFRTDAFYVTVLAVGWAALLLGYNLLAEVALRDASLVDTSIFNSARRRLPFFNSALNGTATLSESGLSGWGGFALVQFQRTVLWFAPLRLGGEMGWRYIPGEYAVEFNPWRTLAAVALYGTVIVYTVRQAGPRRKLAVVTAFGGLLWVFFMINLSAKHIYVSMYSLGLTLLAWVALLGWLGRSQWLVRGLVLASLVLFTASNIIVRNTLHAQSDTLDEYTWDFDRINAAAPADEGTVYLAYGYYRPWCIINNNQCYVLGYYLSDYTLSRHYDQSDFVLSPRPYHITPPFIQAGQSLDLLIPLNPENDVAYLMDKNAAQTRTAPTGDEPLFRFGGAMLLHDWSFVGDVKVRPCQRISIESWWRTDATPDDNYNMQIVMVDDTGGQITEANAPLALSPTQLWQPGAFTLDVRSLTVPCDTPPGEYPLIMGVYDPGDVSPLPVTDAGGSPSGNQVYLTTLFVAE
jgi:hypothetical protein